MKINWKTLILCILIPLAVGFLASVFTSDSVMLFSEITKPPLSPPAWAFPVVWTILFVLMGASSYLVLASKKPQSQIKSALTVYGIQLAFNFFWSIIFFNLQAYLFAFFWLVILWLLIILTIYLFSKINKTAAILLIPYLLWVTFAGYLNYAIYLLN